MGSDFSRRAMLGGALALLAAPAKAADTLRVGRAVVQQFGYTPLDVGIRYGIFKSRGLDVQAANFTGGAKVAQAVAAGALDISLSAGPDMAFTAKGAPQIAVATITDSPAFMGFIVGSQSTARSLDDLKGKKIGVSTVGSLTYWLVDELNRVKGWKNQDAALPVAIGAAPTTVTAALKSGVVDASIASPSDGYELQEAHAGRFLAPISDYVRQIELFVTFASTTIIKQNPDAVRRFLAGWYDTIAYMKTHKAETVAVTMDVIRYPKDIAERCYDDLMPAFSIDGTFKTEALAKLDQSFVDLKTLDKSVNIAKLYTAAFLPHSISHGNEGSR